MAKRPKSPATAAGSSPRPRGTATRGRPRLTPEDLGDRLAAYCRRYDVRLNDEGFPPFPAGRRETEQHREWMALYKAHRRQSERAVPDVAQRQELLAAQRGRCAICGAPLDLDDARLDHGPAARGRGPGVLHARCLQLVELARALGPDALDRVKARL